MKQPQIFVQNIDGKPLMPTTRGCRIRRLLKTGAAKVVGHNPFTVRLIYQTADATQALILGIDPGRTNIGVAVVSESGDCIFSAQLETRNKDVTKLMAEREAHRQKRRHYGRRCKRQRRAKAKGTVSRQAPIQRVLPQTEETITCKEIINKEARFCNRKREDAWLTPTATHLLRTHLNLIAKLEKLLPITSVALEINKFAFMKLENHDIRPWEYQRGPLHGFNSRDDAVYALQEGKCLLCERPRIDHYHHVVPRHERGSDTIANIAGLCNRCHDRVHTEAAVKEELLAKHKGLVKEYAGTSVLNQMLPHLITALEASGKPLDLIPARETAAHRRLLALEKDHHVDAYCIALAAMEVEPRKAAALQKPYLLKQFRRHDRQACNQEMVDRKYYFDGKAVAVNRHKRFEQKADSLEEYLRKNPEARPEKLEVKPHPPLYKRQDRIMQGTLMRHGKRVFVYKTGTPIIGGTPFYAIDTSDRRYKYRECRPILQSSGITFYGRDFTHKS